MLTSKSSATYLLVTSSLCEIRGGMYLLVVPVRTCNANSLGLFLVYLSLLLLISRHCCFGRWPSLPCWLLHILLLWLPISISLCPVVTKHEENPMKFIFLLNTVQYNTISSCYAAMHRSSFPRRRGGRRVSFAFMSLHRNR